MTLSEISAHTEGIHRVYKRLYTQANKCKDLSLPCILFVFIACANLCCAIDLWFCILVGCLCCQYRSSSCSGYNKLQKRVVYFRLATMIYWTKLWKYALCAVDACSHRHWESLVSIGRDVYMRRLRRSHARSRDLHHCFHMKMRSSSSQVDPVLTALSFIVPKQFFWILK